MKYKLYIAENCTECKEVVDFIKSNKIEAQIGNVDLEDVKPPINVFAFPALFKEEILLGYGSDIITYLKNKA